MTEQVTQTQGVTSLGKGNIYSNQKLNVRLTYPYSDTYEYFVQLKPIDLDAERIRDLKTGKGFVIQSSRSIKTDIKNQLGIFSNRYGSTIADIDSFNGKYRCRCGATKGSIMHGEKCPICGTIVKFYDDDISIFGWLILKDKYFIIHPNIYRTLEGFIGATRLARIIEPDVIVNSDGQVIAIGNPTAKKDEPFNGIGMFAFRERYDEILDYYYAKYPTKKLFYEHLKYTVRDITFIHSIGVFSSLLRPSFLESNLSLKYESTNEYYQLLAKLVQDVNRDQLHMDQKIKEKLKLLNDIQVNYNAVYAEIKETLSRKRGDIRSAIGGRYSFSSRAVIRQDPYLKVNEVKLPFAALLELLGQVIINILVKTQNISYSAAYKRWYKAQVKGYDQSIYDIIDNIIKDRNGIPLLINRNPKIK